MEKPFTWEDFQQFEIVRGEVAEVIVDHFRSTPGDGFEADDGKPVRLIGFTADPDLSDFEILEKAFEHYEDILKMLGK